MLTIWGMPKLNNEVLGALLHGTARAWRLKLDERLKPMGLSQAKWRTLLHLSLAAGPLTQTEIAERLGIEEPSLVTLLHRLESEGWVARRSVPRDRRCKTVHLAPRAQRVIAQINWAAARLRHELLADISEHELQTCMRVLAQIRDKADSVEGALTRVHPEGNGQPRNGERIIKVRTRRQAAKRG